MPGPGYLYYRFFSVFFRHYGLQSSQGLNHKNIAESCITNDKCRDMHHSLLYYQDSGLM